MGWWGDMGSLPQKGIITYCASPPYSPFATTKSLTTRLPSLLKLRTPPPQQRNRPSASAPWPARCGATSSTATRASRTTSRSSSCPSGSVRVSHFLTCCRLLTSLHYLLCLASPGRCPCRDFHSIPLLQTTSPLNRRNQRLSRHSTARNRNRLRNLRVGEEVRRVAGEQGGASVPGGEGGRGAPLNRAHGPLHGPRTLPNKPLSISREPSDWSVLQLRGAIRDRGSALHGWAAPTANKHARSSIQFQQTPPGPYHKYK